MHQHLELVFREGGGARAAVGDGRVQRPQARLEILNGHLTSASLVEESEGKLERRHVLLKGRYDALHNLIDGVARRVLCVNHLECRAKFEVVEMTISIHVHVHPHLFLVLCRAVCEGEPINHGVEFVLRNETVAVGVDVLEHLDTALLLHEFASDVRQYHPHFLCAAASLSVVEPLLRCRRVYHLETVEEGADVELAIPAVDEAHQRHDLTLRHVYLAFGEGLLELPRRDDAVTVGVELL
mmetsp:Transcript_30426/g.62736  ORF Transcript_30426/g.62736 Transcript_30426/m.62736 type:complete len:240 (-) Transcript_30426:248-967(-)